MSSEPGASAGSVDDDPLLSAVEALATRVEVLTKSFSKSRKRTIIGLLVVILIAQVVSLATFVTVASGCFIRTTPPKDGSALRTVCNMIPGYDSAEKKGQQNLDQFNKLLGTIPKNAHEIADLKRRVARLEHH